MPALAALVAMSLLALGATLLALPVLVLVAGVRVLARAWAGPVSVTSSPGLTRDALDSSTPLVVAVHGTWAPVTEGKADWARAGSPLHAALAAAIQAQCGTAPIWHSFAWSGDNSTAGRRVAVEALTALVDDATARDSGRLVVLVGHSHGGNIAAVAAQRLAGRPRLRVVTLATPFLTVLARHDTGPLGDLLSLVPGVGLSLLSFVAVKAVAGWSWPWAGAVLAVGLVMSAVLAARLRRDRQSALDALAASTLDGARLDGLRARTLIVSRIGDEADAGLKLTAFATNWIVRTVGRVSLVEETASAMARLGATSVPAVSSAADATVGTNGRDRAGATAPIRQTKWRAVRDWWRPREMATVDLTALMCGLFLLSLLQAIAGTSSTLASVALNVGSSETPPGRWHHLQSTWAGDADASLLSHSQIYDDPIVIREVAAWVSATASGAA